ncbi:MAG: rod shape-determining protein RodA [Holosporaceae bacterium]|jgi:rod shape determining protein RodA|nr:rod shape-determining protein RodA [Holosporaceae bacterium]
MKRSFPNESKILLALLFFLLLISILGQYSASGGLWEGQALRHIMRIFLGIALAAYIFFTDFRFWNNYAYLLYAFVLVSLAIANLAGITKLGAQRWIDLYFFAFQPSEFMKLTIIFALARYYSMLSFIETMEFKSHIFPIFFVLLPALLIFKQPDLGTAALIICTGAGIIFLAGFPPKIFAAIIGSCLLLCPLGWFFLHDYQRNRILTFVDPDRDSLGAGYHILQSKIAVGSGRLWGRGFLQGTQSKLNFLPEKNTDFIFTTIAEEFGFAGSLTVLFLFILICYYFFWVASIFRNKFTKLLCYGLGMLLFSHVFVNIAMAIGLLPVVGIPLPFLSYGGSSMITFMISCGLLMSSLKQKKSGIV